MIGFSIPPNQPQSIAVAEAGDAGCLVGVEGPCFPWRPAKSWVVREIWRPAGDRDRLVEQVGAIDVAAQAAEIGIDPRVGLRHQRAHPVDVGKAEPARLPFGRDAAAVGYGIVIGAEIDPVAEVADRARMDRPLVEARGGRSAVDQGERAHDHRAGARVAHGLLGGDHVLVVDREVDREDLPGVVRPSSSGPGLPGASGPPVACHSALASGTFTPSPTQPNCAKCCAGVPAGQNSRTGGAFFFDALAMGRPASGRRSARRRGRSIRRSRARRCARAAAMPARWQGRASPARAAAVGQPALAGVLGARSWPCRCGGGDLFAAHRLGGLRVDVPHRRVPAEQQQAGTALRRGEGCAGCPRRFPDFSVRWVEAIVSGHRIVAVPAPRVAAH